MPKAYNPEAVNTSGYTPPITDAQREAAKAAQRQYLREWRRNHPELVRAQHERYWAKKAAKMAAEAENSTV